MSLILPTDLIGIQQNMGSPKVFLGISIKKNKKQEYKISMEDTIEKLENDYKIVPTSRKLITPIAKGFETDNKAPFLNEKDHSQYRSIIGSLIFIANTVRLDISFAVSYLSRYLQAPRTCHLKSAFRVVHYLIQTKSYGIKFSSNNMSVPYKDFRYLDKTGDVFIIDYPNYGKYKLATITDADFAADKEDRTSQSGHITLLNNNIISWSSKKQKCVALSTVESEYISLSEGIKSSIYFRNLLKEMKSSTTVIDLIGDNKASLTLSSHNTQHQKTKHIDVRYHHFRDLVNKKIIKINYVNTKDNISDMLNLIQPHITSEFD